MGWWKIDSVENGQIDWAHESPGDPKLVNALPGQEKTDELYNGDGPADLMDTALDQINKRYIAAWGRPAKEDELKAVFNFCVGGMFSAE